MAISMRGLCGLAMALGGAGCGGASSSDAPADPAQLIAAACDQIVGLNCSALTTEECTDSLNEERAESVNAGCGTQFNAIAQCFSEKLTSCEQYGDDVCEPEFDALQACESDGTDDCSLGVGGAGPGAPPYYQQCMVSCGSWAATCETVSSPTVECSCTSGPKAGTTFTITSCQKIGSSLGAQHCAG